MAKEVKLSRQPTILLQFLQLLFLKGGSRITKPRSVESNRFTTRTLLRKCGCLWSDLLLSDGSAFVHRFTAFALEGLENLCRLIIFMRDQNI